MAGSPEPYEFQEFGRSPEDRLADKLYAESDEGARRAENDRDWFGLMEWVAIRKSLTFDAGRGVEQYD